VGVLLAAGASAWEPTALEVLGSTARLGLVKRCLDLPDLLATAAAGTAQVAVVSDQLPGLDADSVHRLARDGVRTVAVVSPTAGRRAGEDRLASRARLLRLGVARVVDEDAVATLGDHVLDATEQELRLEGAGGAVDGTRVAPPPEGGPVTAAPVAVGDQDVVADGATQGSVVAVWGPTGAPGRTTVAIALAAESAARGVSVTLVDADPYGGAVGQHLAVLDEVSGLLAAARLANAGQLDRTRLVELARGVGPGLRLVSGLPRPDRWTEVRPQVLVEVLDVARTLDEMVVVDTGFGLPSTPLDPFAAGPARDEITLGVLETADRLVVVGSADPVGLTRLVRALRDVTEVRPEGPQVVVVNRMRSSLGWSAREVGDLVTQVVPAARLVFLPEDRLAVDRALVSGRTLVESGDGPLRRALAELAGLLLPDAETAGAQPRDRVRR
jgi:MinD-like ATPase involved in chromosome partitioning or flagellar assembly